ncbi:hypothetical protein HYFRA_00009589 [Hymenoscyphus fraxineus]|uniref:PHD-type domain-containing protein n=1 Tax=Hymenoscyphus fraxineus TaxID=746836 RepID=A0A9N9L0T7_9HELO|nr:hypothetical protein HYFRA_00009589 [Hymenoscyphus fraxineus]
MDDRKASASKPSLTVGTSSARNSPAIGSSSSSVASMSSSSRPKVCYVCKEGEFLPTKALVRCVRCKRFWHHNCHAPPVSRDMHDLQKPFSCARCVKKASTAQSTHSNATATSLSEAHNGSQSAPGFSCEVSGCNRMPMKDLKSARRICKHHSISEKHMLSANKPRPQVAMKSARVDRSKMKPPRRVESQAVPKDRKHRHPSMNKSIDSTGYDTNSGESDIGLDMRNSRAKNVDVSLATLQLEGTQGFAKHTGSAIELSSSPMDESSRAQKQLSEWIERHCDEQLQTNLTSWLKTHASGHTTEDEWWPKLRDLVCTAASGSTAIDCLNRAILFRLESQRPSGSTGSMWQVEQEDVENAIELLKSNTEYPISAVQLMEVHACYHACGILVPRDPDPVLRGSSREAAADDNRREWIRAYDEEEIEYDLPSPRPISNLLGLQDNMDRDPEHASPHILAADHRDSRPPSVGLRGTDTLDVEDDEEYTPTLNPLQPHSDGDVARALETRPINTTREPLGELADQGIEHCAPRPKGNSNGYEPSFKLPPSISSITGQRGISNTSSASENALTGVKHALEAPSSSREAKRRAHTDLVGAEISRQLQAQKEPQLDPMASSTISPEPAISLKHNSLAGTGYLWEAPPGSFDAKNRARSGVVDAEMDEWLYGAKKIKEHDSEYPMPDHEFIRSQRWGHINPTTDWPKLPLSGEALRRKRAEIDARPRRKELFGTGLSEAIKKERLEKYGCIYMVKPPGPITPAYLEHKAKLEKMIRVPNIDNYEPAVRNNKLGMRERPTTTITEIIDGREVTRQKKKSELLWIERHDAIVDIVFHFWRGY